MVQEFKESIASIFEDVLNDKELPSRFKSLHPSIYEEMVKEAIVQEGFPHNANLNKIRYDFIITNNQSPEKWAEEYMIEGEMDEETTSVIGHDDIEVYVIDHLENTNVNITINEQLSNWIEHNPTVEYIASKIENMFNPLEMISFMKRNNYIDLYKKEEACIEAGYPREESYNVEYEIKNLKIKTPFETLAEVYKEEIENDNTTVQIYLDNNLYDNLITEVEYEVEVEEK